LPIGQQKWHGCKTACTSRIEKYLQWWCNSRLKKYNLKLIFANLLKKLFGPGTDYKALVEKGAIIVDVRSPGEFKSGHLKGSLNVPLETVKQKAAELKKKNKPVITVCRSGNRSGMAKAILAGNGIEVYNGGAWNSLQNKI
jgi:rhodanese-related sulfurtransferase